jgi:hypothetical protein
MLEVYLFPEREAVDIRAFKGNYIFSEGFGDSAHYTSVEGIARSAIVNKTVDKAMDKAGKTSAQHNNNSTHVNRFLNHNKKRDKTIVDGFLPLEPLNL